MFSIHIVDDYFAYIIEFLTTGNATTEYNEKQRKQLVVKAKKFSIVASQLYNNKERRTCDGLHIAKV